MSIHEDMYGKQRDELYPEALGLLTYASEYSDGNISVSLLQRRFRIGYTLAAMIIDRMEDEGYVGALELGKPRKVLRTA